MEQLFRASGTLDHGFVGQIAYTVCLESVYQALDICFSFNKRRFSPEDVTAERIAETKRICLEKYGLTGTDEQARDVILGDMKTEIHTLAELNGEFIGCVHKQLETRHMLYENGEATEGCIPQTTFSGVLRVTLLVFNVLMDDTAYTLTVSAR